MGKKLKEKKIPYKKTDSARMPDDPVPKEPKSRNLISWVVFLSTISIVLISSITIAFPAAIVVSDTLKIPGIDPVAPDPFEPGSLLGELIVINIIFLFLLFLYFKDKLPRSISSIFRELLNFEVSRKVAFIIIVILISIYISASVNELASEEIWQDYIVVKEKLEKWSFSEVLVSFDPHVQYFLTWTSMNLFGNYKIIPFMASISLLITVYFITKTITQKRFPGIISMIVVLQSNVFLTFDTSVAYTNFWILFYLLSLYFVFRSWPLSPVMYILSIPSKFLTAAFLPMSLFFIFRAEIPQKKKILILSSTIAIFFSGIGFALALDVNILGIGGVNEGFSSDEFWMGFTSFAIQLRFDVLIILLLIPLIISLFVASRRGIRQAESIMILIAGSLILAPILTGFTDQTNQPYRFVSLIMFFAIGVGVLLAKRQV